MLFMLLMTTAGVVMLKSADGNLIKYWSTLDMSCIVFYLEKQFLPTHSGTDDITEN